MPKNEEVPINQVPPAKPVFETSTDAELRSKAESTFAANPDARALLYAEGHFFLEDAWHHAKSFGKKVVKVLRDFEEAVKAEAEKIEAEVEAEVEKVEDEVAEARNDEEEEDDEDEEDEEPIKNKATNGNRKGNK